MLLNQSKKTKTAFWHPVAPKKVEGREACLLTGRAMRGANMVEGAIAVMLVITGLIGAGLLLMNSGLLMYNQEKIGFVAHGAAIYAAACTNSASRQSDVEAQVENTMANLGLSAGNTSTTIQDISINSKPAVSVTVTANLPTMMTSNFANLLPQAVQLKETAVALKPINTMKYLVVIHPLMGSLVTVPLLDPDGVLPNDGLPAWELSLAGVRKVR